MLVQSEAQSKYGSAFEKSFFGRQPGARGEAMGRGGVALSGDILSSFYNPAGLAGAIGLNFCTSFSEDSNGLERADHTILGAGIPVGRYVGVGFSWYHLDYGTTAGHPRQGSHTYAPNSSIYTLTLAAKPAARFYVGVNLNLFRASFAEQKENSIWPDFGIMKVFHWARSGNIQHRASMGSSLSNFTNSGIAGPGGDEDLPQVFRIGMSYRISWAHRSWHDRLRTLGLLSHLEYQNVLNSDYRDAYKIGSEIRLLEILALRIGYYLGNISGPEPDVSEDWVGETTYGFGLGLPISELAEGAPPLRVSFDWVRREDASETLGSADTVRYSVYTLSVDWLF
jgi:hypothetical protein